MNLEKLLTTKDPKDWESLSDEELEKLLKPYFLVTRPKKENLKPKAEAKVAGQGWRSVSKNLIAEVAKLNAQRKS